MSQLEELASRRRAGMGLLPYIRAERDVAACHTCCKFHPLELGNEAQSYADFAFRHPIERGCVATRLNPDQARRMVLRAQRRRKLRHDSILNFTHNASVLEAFQSSDQSLDLTSFDGLANSATAGWGSQMVDNATNLYLDYLAAVKLGAVNTAPASDKAVYIFGATALNSTDLPATGGSGGALPSSTTTAAATTFPSVSTLPSVLPLIFTLPYPVQNIALQTPLFSHARAFGGVEGLKVWWAAVNFAGFTFAAAGNNSFKYRGIYLTVA